MKTEKLISLAQRLIKACSQETPNLGDVKQICQVKSYSEKMNESARIREKDLIISKDISFHLKATHLAVIAFDDMLQDEFGVKFLVYDKTNSHTFTNEQRQLLLLRKVLRNLHEFQQIQEEIMIKNLEQEPSMKKVSCI